jgi:AraC family transcriptional regulator, transcriptional activator of pobA
MQAKTYYRGIYQQNSIDFVEGLIHVNKFPFVGNEFIKVAKPHAHNFLQVFLLEEGTTTLHHDEQSFTVTAPAFFTIPKNVEHGFTSSDDCRGWIINLSDNFLENILKKDANMVMELDMIHIEHLEEGEETERIILAMRKIVSEFNQNLSGKVIMLQSLVSILMVRLHRLPKKTTDYLLPKNLDNASKIYFRRFMQLVKTANSFKISIEEYAANLSISQGHLYRVCQTIAGKSPKDIITDYFMLEAQKGLINIEKSITQVAFDISFEDPAYFSRLFKKRTGFSPKEFRDKQGIKST